MFDQRDSSEPKPHLPNNPSPRNCDDTRHFDINLPPVPDATGLFVTNLHPNNSRLAHHTLDLDSALALVRLSAAPASVSISKDGRLVGVGQRDGKVAIFDATAGHSIASRQVGRDGAFALLELVPGNEAITATGRTIALGGKVIEAAGDVIAMRSSPDGSHLAAALAGGKVAVYKLPELQRIASLSIPRGFLASLVSGSKDSVSSIAFSPDGRSLAAALDNGKKSAVYLFDSLTGEPRYGGKPFDPCSAGPVTDRPRGFNPTISSISFTPDGSSLSVLYRTYPGSNRQWVDKLFTQPLPSGDPRNAGVSYYQANTPLPGEGMSAAHSPSGSFVAIGHSGTVGFGASTYIGYRWWQNGLIPKVRLIDTQTGETKKCLIGHSDAVDFVSFTPAGDRLITASRDKAMVIWDVAKLFEGRQRTAAFDSGSFLVDHPTGRGVVGCYPGGMIMEDREI